MIIDLNEKEIKKCINFANASAPTQQGIEFGQQDTKDRGIAETAKDTIVGKMAEVAVAKMLRENYKIHCPLDFEIYKHGGDDCDLKIFRWDIDIKATVKGRWLFVERDRFIMRKNQRYNNIPDAFISCTVEVINSIPTGKVRINGCIQTEKFLNDAIQIRKGEFIPPNTNTQMQADNYGIEIDKLFNDWDEIVNGMYLATPFKKSKIEIHWN